MLTSIGVLLIFTFIVKYDIYLINFHQKYKALHQILTLSQHYTLIYDNFKL